eukprot:TRINITY_DN165_c0_g1_i1.p1 TRINITY_DN165_c0_g1~~TRINITY_DN165_c0_g1_i1.p1  ORF type:complete len:453 (-),score=88.58 TRINITY_DN165_c0_g1_i1:32-1390(-)
MYSQFFVLSTRGDPIIHKNYRADAGGREPAEIFFRVVRENKGDAPPIFIEDNISYVSLKRNGLYFLLTTRFNVSPVTSIELLNRIVRCFKDFCGLLNEEAIRRNFVLIYELLDELLDFGYPQMTTPGQLKPHIHNETLLLEEQMGATGGGGDVATVVSGFLDNIRQVATGGQRQTASLSSSRPITEPSTKDEIFIDVLERLNIILNSRGDVQLCHIEGVIQMKSFVNGQPEMRVGLNEQLILGKNAYSAYGAPQIDHWIFHECVSPIEFEASRTLSFIPPEGEFDLMRYRVTKDSVSIPLRLSPYCEEYPSDHRIELNLKLRCELAQTSFAANLRLAIPLPSNIVTAQCERDYSTESTTEVKDKHVFWIIPKLVGTTEINLKIKILLPASGDAAAAKREITNIAMAFELPMYVCSGLEVARLQVFDRGAAVTPHRWVRYVTQSNSYVTRLEL